MAIEKLGTERITEAKYLNNVLVRPAIGFGDSLKIETDENHVYIGGYQKGSSLFNFINGVLPIVSIILLKYFIKNLYFLLETTIQEVSLILIQETYFLLRHHRGKQKLF